MKDEHWLVSVYAKTGTERYRLKSKTDVMVSIAMTYSALRLSEDYRVEETDTEVIRVMEIDPRKNGEETLAVEAERLPPLMSGATHF